MNSTSSSDGSGLCVQGLKTWEDWLSTLAPVVLFIISEILGVKNGQGKCASLIQFCSSVVLSLKEALTKAKKTGEENSVPPDTKEEASLPQWRNKITKPIPSTSS